MSIHKAIEQVALDLSEKNGRVTGQDSGDWLEAERIVEKWHKDKSGR